jgi:hypothetical protein
MKDGGMYQIAKKVKELRQFTIKEDGKIDVAWFI